MLGGRSYDQSRADREAPARQPQTGTHTPVLANDGADLAAALQTIIEIGDPQALAESVGDAFPGASVSVLHHEGRFEVEMRQHGLLRPLKAAELSDGTLRYLLWIAALLTPRPPSAPGPERAGNEPAPRAPARARPADRPRGRAFADHCRVARGAPHRRARGTSGPQLGDAGEEPGGNGNRRCRPARSP